MEKVIYFSICYFTMATEIRFMESEIQKNLKKKKKKKIISIKENREDDNEEKDIPLPNSE